MPIINIARISHWTFRHIQTISAETKELGDKNTHGEIRWILPQVICGQYLETVYIARLLIAEKAIIEECQIFHMHLKTTPTLAIMKSSPVIAGKCHNEVKNLLLHLHKRKNDSKSISIIISLYTPTTTSVLSMFNIIPWT